MTKKQRIKQARKDLLMKWINSGLATANKRIDMFTTLLVDDIMPFVFKCIGFAYVCMKVWSL